VGKAKIEVARARRDLTEYVREKEAREQGGFFSSPLDVAVAEPAPEPEPQPVVRPDASGEAGFQDLNWVGKAILDGENQGEPQRRSHGALSNFVPRGKFLANLCPVVWAERAMHAINNESDPDDKQIKS